MNFKKTLNMFILLSIIFLVAGTVSATDLNCDNHILTEDDSSGAEKISVSENELMESKITPSGNSFYDIQDSTNYAKENDVVELSGTYKSSNNQLNLNKSLTV